MSAINPVPAEYGSSDSLRIAKDISWVIKTLWSGAIVTVFAAVWVAALAADVKTNAEKIDKAATQAQVATVIEALDDIKSSLRDADTRQRAIQTDVAKLEAQVDAIEKKD
jgi:hypothetical protein